MMQVLKYCTRNGKRKQQNLIVQQSFHTRLRWFLPLSEKQFMQKIGDRKQLCRINCDTAEMYQRILLPKRGTSRRSCFHHLPGYFQHVKTLLITADMREQLQFAQLKPNPEKLSPFLSRRQSRQLACFWSATSTSPTLLTTAWCVT